MTILWICLLPVLFLFIAVLLILIITRYQKHTYLFVVIPLIATSFFTASIFFSVVEDSDGFIRFLFVSPLLIVSGVGLLVVLWFAIREREEDRPGNYLSNYHLVCYTLVCLSSFIGLFGSNVIIAQCERIHILTGDGIIAVLNQYQADRGKYPDTLTELIPEYLSMDNIQSCYGHSVRKILNDGISVNGFLYQNCPDGMFKISIPEMGSGQYHVYDPSQEKWLVTQVDPIDDPFRPFSCPGSK